MQQTIRPELGKGISLHFPGKLVFGKGEAGRLPGEILKMDGRRILIITVGPLLPALHPLIEELKASSLEVMTDTGITREPSFSDFRTLMKTISPFRPDIIVGIGGGSVLDMAKLAAAQLDNEQSLEEYVGNGLLKGRKKKLICLPATSGTGSEVSPNAILVDDADGQKKGIISPYLVPDLVIVDPLLTVSVPPSVTAATGIDALTHCLEAYTNKFSHPIVDLYAFEGMRLIAANIVQAVRQGEDEEARTAVALGSLYGGICLGPVNTAAVHALSYPLGSQFHLPHGLSNALLLPYVMEYNLAAVPCRYAKVAEALGCPRSGDEREMAEEGVRRIKTLIAQCGLPLRLRDAGVTADALPVMAAEAMKVQRLLKNNPRPVTLDDAIDIFKKAF